MTHLPAPRSVGIGAGRQGFHADYTDRMTLENLRYQKLRTSGQFP